MRYELRSIGVWAFVRISFFIHLVVGFIAGIIGAVVFGMMAALLSSMPYGASDSGIDPAAFGPALLIILPIVYSIGFAVLGTVFSAVVVAIYNLMVKMVGGIEFDLEPATLTDATTPAQPTYSAPIYTTPPPPPSGPSYTPPPPSGAAQTPPVTPPKYDWTPPPTDKPHDSGPENQ
jgi:hypothetical protein